MQLLNCAELTKNLIRIWKMVTLTPYGEGEWVGPDGSWAIRRTKSHIPRKWGRIQLGRRSDQWEWKGVKRGKEG